MDKDSAHNKNQNESEGSKKLKKQIPKCNHDKQCYYCFSTKEYECAECYKKLEKQKIKRVVIPIDELKQIDQQINKNVYITLITHLLEAKKNVSKQFEDQVLETRDLEQRLYRELFCPESKKFFGICIM
jgi:hypothetical protein